MDVGERATQRVGLPVTEFLFESNCLAHVSREGASQNPRSPIGGRGFRMQG